MPAKLSKLQQELITALTPASPGEVRFITEHGNAVYVVPAEGQQWCILTAVSTATRLSLIQRQVIVSVKRETSNMAGAPRTIRVWVLRPTDIPATYVLDLETAAHSARVENDDRNGYSSNPFQPRTRFGEPHGRRRDLDDAQDEAEVDHILHELCVAQLPNMTYEDAYRLLFRLQALARLV